jgi:hypothetical protein
MGEESMAFEIGELCAGGNGSEYQHERDNQ